MSSKTKTTTSEEATHARVPKLRFPEFRGAPGWQPKRLGLALKFQAGFPFPSSGFNDSGNGLRLIRNRDLRSDDIVVSYSGDFDPSFVVRNGDVLVGMDGDFTPSVWEKGEALLNQRVGRILPRGDNDHRFLLHLLTLSLKGIEQATARTTVKHLSHSAVEDKHEPLPPPAEQQKIAECLSSVDELMAAQARKVDALKTHKKGLMQQLFPREGETQPRLRFPEFQNAGEWEEVPLGDIAEIKLGKMLDKQKHTTGHLLPYLNNLAVRWNEVNTSDLPKMYFNDREMDRFGLRAGDVVVCEGGEPGRAAVWDGRMPDLKFQKAIHRVRFNVPFEPKILVLHLENLAGTTQFEMLFTGGGIKHLTGETFSRLKVPLIPHAEQQRIASCLSSLDALITAETQKLEVLKTHKKGLMQQFFPSPEETADL